jgi:alpha-ketoglutarate-dependent 2,4-dichlorophenoxyacetate dioxygenase
MPTATALHPIFAARIEDVSRALIGQLIAFADNPDLIYSHRWEKGDVVVSDNRAVMHRATPFASTSERRRMVRTTVSCRPVVQ